MKTTEISIFEQKDYKSFINQRIETMPQRGRGFKTIIAKTLACQNAYVSQVLNGQANLTPEQALKIAQLFELDEVETRHLVLLVQFERAGTKDLKRHYQDLVDEAKAKRSTLSERFKVKDELTLEDQIRYYSEWYFAVFHVITSIPKFRSAQMIAQALKLPLNLVIRNLEFLKKCNLLTIENGEYRMAKTRIHLSSDSPLISKHHTNWRLQALRSLEKGPSHGLHYTSVATLSKSDSQKIKLLLADTLERYNKTVEASPEEQCVCLTLDFFEVTES